MREGANLANSACGSSTGGESESQSSCVPPCTVAHGNVAPPSFTGSPSYANTSVSCNETMFSEPSPFFEIDSLQYSKAIRDECCTLDSGRADILLLENLYNNVDLPPDLSFQLKDVLSKYSHLFTKRSDFCTLYKNTINTGGSRPTACHTRPMIPSKRAILQNLL